MAAASSELTMPGGTSCGKAYLASTPIGFVSVLDDTEEDGERRSPGCPNDMVEPDAPISLMVLSRTRTVKKKQT